MANGMTQDKNLVSKYDIQGVKVINLVKLKVVYSEVKLLQLSCSQIETNCSAVLFYIRTFRILTIE